MHLSIGLIWQLSGTSVILHKRLYMHSSRFTCKPLTATPILCGLEAECKSLDSCRVACLISECTQTLHHQSTSPLSSSGLRLRRRLRPRSSRSRLRLRPLRRLSSRLSLPDLQGAPEVGAEFNTQ